MRPEHTPAPKAVEGLARSAAFVVLVALAGAACAGRGVDDVSPSAPAGDGWARRVAAFPVLAADGEPYAFPFLGGLNVPRPQLVDIDADGDLDLFVQERSDEVMFLEQTGAGFEWRTDRFQDLSVGEWFRFIDMDDDGDPDLLTEQPFSLIRYYRNEGGRLVLAADTLRDTAGKPIYSDRQNIPNVADIDCDRRPDLFLGRLSGTVTRYEATASVGDTLPRFELVTDRFEDIEIVAQIGSMHGANSMVFADVDGDGDQDLFWGDFFEPGLLYIENTGTCEDPNLTGEPIPFPVGDPVLTSGFNVPAVADLGGDGGFDVMIGVLGGAYNPNRTAADNLYLLESAGDAYALRTRRFLDGIDLGAESVPAVGDVDGDGDLDFLLAAKLDPAEPTTSRVVLFENTGSATAPAFRLADTLAVAGSYHFAPDLADLDGDEDLDLLLGTWNDGVRVAWNQGDARRPRWVPADSALLSLSRGSHTVPSAADLDGDGDLDVIVGEASGTLNLFVNAGTAKQPRFEPREDYGGFDVGRRAAPDLLDLDGDGDPDMVVGHEDGGPVCFLNEGGELRAWTCPGFPELLPYGAPRLADVDGDGDLDLLVGNLAGGVAYYENEGR